MVGSRKDFRDTTQPDYPGYSPTHVYKRPLYKKAT